MKNLDLSKKIKRWTDLSIVEGTMMEQQQRKMFYLSLVILLFGILFYAFMLPFPNSHFFYLNGFTLLFTSLLSIGYFTRRVKLNTAFALILLAVHLEIGVEMVYSALLLDYPYWRALILSNLSFAILFTLFSVAAYMPLLTLLQSLITVGAYITCACLTNGIFIKAFAFPIAIIFFVLVSYSRYQFSADKKLLNQSKQYLEEENQILSALEVNKPELLAFARLVNSSKSGEVNNDLLDALGENTKRNLYAAVAAYMKQEQFTKDRIHEAFPELSNSEVVICSWILQDYSTNKIAEKLFRSEGNISSQRSNIRAKLGLAKGDDLKAALVARLAAKDQHKLYKLFKSHS